jgi:cyclase
VSDFVRVIPCLDIKEGRVVKGVKFVDLVDARDPAEAAAAYSEQGADEIVMLDIAASVEGRKTRAEWVQRVVEAVKVPLGVGGGIADLDTMQELFDLGVSKVSINTAAARNPQLVKDASEKFGPERLVVAVDAQKAQKGDDGFEVLVSGGNERIQLDLVAWAKEVESLGAGEILLTSKDADGVKTGYDIPMTRAVADAVSIPVIASGGCGALEHMAAAVKEAHADAVLAASVFHFGEFTVRDVKEYLKGEGIPVSL